MCSTKSNVLLFQLVISVGFLEINMCNGAQEHFNLHNLQTNLSFDSQVNTLIQKTRMSLKEVQTIEDLVRDVEGALRDEWPGTKVVPYGSIISGIGLHSSDIDLYVSLPQWAKKNTPAYQLVSRAEKILKSYKNRYLFENVTAKYTFHSIDEVPIVKLYHKKTKQYCDISFNAISVYENRLITHLIHTDERAFKLMFLVKYWCKLMKFTANICFLIRNLVIFYLQQLNMLPPIYSLQKMSLRNDSVNSWDTSFEEPFYFYYNPHEISIYNLLGGFFQYYSSFKFKKYIISTYAGYPIERIIFNNVTTVPDIFVSYKRIVGKNEQYPLNITSEFCVPQFFVHNFNNGNKIDKTAAKVIINVFKIAARIYEENDEHDFLRILFNKYSYIHYYSTNRCL